MTSFERALQLVLEHSQDYGTEKISLSESEHRVLAEPIYADRDFPPFDRSTKDGIAIHSKALANNRTHFKVSGVAQAGSPQLELMSLEHCIEIMTGAMLPKNADTVVMYEHLEKMDDGFEIRKEVKAGQNIHYQASDVVKGKVLLEPGVKITAAEIGALASVGKYEVLVKTNPVAAVISTGDELVDIDEVPLPYQIRKSNSYSLKSLLKKEMVQSDMYHLTDDKNILEEELDAYLQKYDVLLLSGGVSKGKFDFLPETFDSLGVKKVFHKVLQRPGKPFWFGVHEERNTLVFAFPGNPVSTFVNYHMYFIPWLNKTLGLDHSQITVFLKEPVENTIDLTMFKGVKISMEAGNLLAEEIKTTGSGNVIGLTKVDGYIQLPPESSFKKGEQVRFVPTRNLI